MGSLLQDLPELRGLAVHPLLAPAIERDADLALGLVTLAPGQSVELHRHDRPETLFVVTGVVHVQRGAGAAELTAPSAAFVPADAAHGIRALDAPATVLLSYSRGARAAPIGSTFVEPGEDRTGWPNPNRISGANPLYRWALAEEFEPWVPIEPTKGWRLRMRYLFDPRRGAPEFVVGTGEIEPRTRYTRHHHEPSELYFVLEGTGTIHVGEDAHAVVPGSAVYVPPNVPHGIDTASDRLRFWWVYGLEGCGEDWTWEADELVHPHPDGSPGAQRS